MSASPAPAVRPDERHTRRHPCQVCGGYDTRPRGRGERCHGYSGDVAIFCSNESYGASVRKTAGGLDIHRRYGPCECGMTHNAALDTAPAPRPIRPSVRPSVRPMPAQDAPPAHQEAQEAAPAPAGERLVQWKRPAAEWVYRDRAGDPVYKVVRYPVVDTATGEIDKTYLPWRRDPSTGRYVKGLAGVTCIPYRLPELIASAASDPEALIFLVEGEKCAEALAAAGLIATATQGGAQSWAKSAAAMCEALAGRHVVILPDHDTPGAKYAGDAARSLLPVAASLRVLELPDMREEGGDVADWLAAGHTVEELGQLARGVPVMLRPALASVGDSVEAEAGQDHAGTSGASDAVLAALLDSLTAGGDVRNVYRQAGRLAQLDAADYAHVRHALKKRLGAALKLSDLDAAVREIRQQQKRQQKQHQQQQRQKRQEGAREQDKAEEAIAGARELCDSRYGTLYYADADEYTGLYVASDRGRLRCILSARIAILRVDASAARGRGSEIRASLTSPLWPDRPYICLFTDEEAVSGKVYSSSGLVGVLQTIPTSKADCELAWQGIRALAALAVKQQPDMRIQLVSALGWHGGVWVRGNGHIDAVAARVGGSIAAAVPESWPQIIPADPDALPAVVDASVIRLILDFWPDDITLFPLAAIGACARVMRQEEDGRLLWELELFGNTDWLKSAFINWLLRLFFGAGYRYSTGTQLKWGKGSGGDTLLGRQIARSRLPYHGYMTFDHDQLPKMEEHEAQQNDRIHSAMDTGNDSRGGAKSDREGNLQERPNASGLLIRSGEGSPYVYTLPRGKESADARCVTFILEGASLPGRAERRHKSEELDRRSCEMDALSILYTRWLASLASADGAAQWERIKVAAARLVTAEELTGAYPHAHSRAVQQCQDIAAGLLSYCLFLSAADLDSGTFAPAIRDGAALAEELKGRIAVLIRERLAAADSLARQYQEARGGNTSNEAMAAAFMTAILQEVTNGGYRLTSQDGDGPALSLPVAAEYTGWEPYKYTTRDSAGDVRELSDWRPRQRTIPLGREADKGRYIACNRTALETLARSAAEANRGIHFISMRRLLHDLLEAGAILPGTDEDHPYTRYTRVGDKSDWLVYFRANRIWKGASEETPSAPGDGTQEATQEATPQDHEQAAQEAAQEAAQPAQIVQDHAQPLDASASEDSGEQEEEWNLYEEAE